ncbi:proline-rich protein 2-like [Prinia subflava]|uniref:proline-rich protein 2-like n=1 Tax=Prinia subflava TaxID=208062 RepID=UPI002FE26B25
MRGGAAAAEPSELPPPLAANGREPLGWYRALSEEDICHTPPPPPPTAPRPAAPAADGPAAGISTCPGSIGRRPRPPLWAPLAGDNATGGNRSFLIPARGKLHPALCWAAAAAAHPRRIPPGKLQDQQRAGKTSGSRRRKALGAASPLLGGRIPPPWGPHPRFPPGAPASPPRVLTVLPARGRRRRLLCPSGLGVCKEKDNNHGVLQALAQTAILSLNARVMYSLDSTKPPANGTKNH